MYLTLICNTLRRSPKLLEHYFNEDDQLISCSQLSDDLSPTPSPPPGQPSQPNPQDRSPPPIHATRSTSKSGETLLPNGTSSTTTAAAGRGGGGGTLCATLSTPSGRRSLGSDHVLAFSGGRASSVLVPRGGGQDERDNDREGRGERDQEEEEGEEEDGGGEGEEDMEGGLSFSQMSQMSQFSTFSNMRWVVCW